MAMEGIGESALDVLSRAATMLQEQSPIHITNDEPKHQTSKQLPSSKWKRERRTKPEYTRKPDQPKPNDTQPIINGQQQRDRESPISRLEEEQTSTTANGHVDDSPLDMSVRHRGLPPSYNQAINDPSFRSSYKTSAVQDVRGSSSSSCDVPTPTPQASVCNVNGSGNAGNTRDELPSGISMCDPIIDEHFRRSLGKAYMTVFNNNNNSNQQQQTSTVAAANSSKDNLPPTNSSNNRTSPIPIHSSSSHPTTLSAKTNNQQTQAKSSVSPCNSTESSISTVKNDNQQTVTARKVTIVNTATNITTVSDLMDGAGLSVDDHFAKALGDTWLKLNGKKDSGNSENVGLKTTSSVSVVENGNANSMVSI